MFEIYGEKKEEKNLSRFENFKFDINESYFGPQAFISFDTKTKAGLKIVIRLDIIAPIRHHKTIGKGSILAAVSSYIPGDETQRICILGSFSKDKLLINEPYVTHAPNVVTYGVSSEDLKMDDISIKIGQNRSIKDPTLGDILNENFAYIQIKTQKEGNFFVIIISKIVSEDQEAEYITSYYGVISKSSMDTFERLGTILKPISRVV